MLRRTPTAVYILLRPGVHFKPIKGYALLADGNRSQLCPNLAIESILVHAQVGRGVAQAKESWQGRWHPSAPQINRGDLFSDVPQFSADSQSRPQVDLSLRRGD